MGYLVGIGAQKAGTTWLAEYFYGHPDVFMSPYKEMRYFDSYHIRRLAADNWRLYFRRRNINLTKYGENNSILTLSQSRELHSLYLRTCLRSDRAYCAFLNYGAKGKKLAAEITPTYTDLDATGFRHMADCLPGVKVLLIARNPVDRFISQVRMDRSYGKRRGHRPIEELLTHPVYARRSDYKRTLIEVEKAIDPSRIHVAFFERLFDSHHNEYELKRLCNFLGISHENPSTTARSNAARDKSFTLDDDQRRIVARHYEDVMQFMSRYDGGLPSSWRAELDRL